ncbi:MAG: MaoC family dehydratase N-terminal domain-containing protein [Burkholderiales bacterium]
MTSTPEYMTWLGRVEEQVDLITVDKVRALRATLDYADLEAHEGEPLPPAWHWIFCNAVAPAANLGRDGHPAKGGFLPPVPLPRRMWAGSRLEFLAPLKVGDRITRRSEIVSIKPKEGSSGPLVFVTVRHQIRGATGGEVIDEQDLVYREDPKPGAPAAKAEPAGAAEISHRLTPDATMLFRYSALTFNGHRIHYDRDYATQVEGYAGLVIHGPVLATLMIELVRRERPNETIRGFRFAGKRPATVPMTLDVGARRAGDGYDTWVAVDGGVSSAGHVVIA